MHQTGQRAVRGVADGVGQVLGIGDRFLRSVGEELPRHGGGPRGQGAQMGRQLFRRDGHGFFHDKARRPRYIEHEAV